MNLEIRPADWEGFAAVMGERGGCGGCWCMLWRRTKAEMEAGKGAGNRAAMAEIFASGQVPGLVAWQDGVAVGWIQVDRRAAFPRLAHARVLRPVDAEPVWSVTCFLVDRTVRRQGVSVALLEAACAFARDRGATIIEGYPVETPSTRYPPVYAWTGFVAAFRAAGFEEVARRSPTRPIMRRQLA
jgi:GNAT superfamily N-acetyltransferase